MSRYGVLGPILVVGDDGAVVAVRGDRQRRLLGVLLAFANQVVSAERLAAALWGDDLPADAAGALHTTVSRLRRALEAGVRSSGAPGAVITEAAGYLLRVGPEGLDAERFERLAEEGRAALASDPARALATLDQALELWRGPAFGELADMAVLAPEAARLEELRLAAAEDRAEALLALGRHSEAGAAAEAFVVEHPLRERAWAQLMLARYRGGRHSEALRAYERYRRLLSEELGLEPSVAMRQLEERILRHEMAPPDLAPSALRPDGPHARMAPLPRMVPPARTSADAPTTVTAR